MAVNTKVSQYVQEMKKKQRPQNAVQTKTTQYAQNKTVKPPVQKAPAWNGSTQMSASVASGLDKAIAGAGAASQSAAKAQNLTKPGVTAAKVEEAKPQIKAANKAARQARLQELVTAASAASIHGAGAQQSRGALMDAMMKAEQNARQKRMQATETAAVRDRDWYDRRTQAYSNLASNPNYDYLSQHRLAGLGAVDDLAYAYINGDEKAKEIAASMTRTGNNPLSKYDYMSPEQKNDYRYIYATMGKEQADDYLDYISYELNAKQAGEYTNIWAQEARDNPVMASAASVGMNAASGAGFGDVALQLATKKRNDYKPVDYNRLGSMPSQMTEAVRGTIAGDLQAQGRDKMAFLYQTGMSMADSLFAMAGGIGGAGSAAAKVAGNFGTVLLGGAAATHAMQAAHANGATDRQAFATGLAAGMAETVFEKISLGVLLGSGSADTVSKFIKSVLKNAGVEGSEELFTDLANSVAEAMILGDKSSYNMSVQFYMSQGMSREEAELKASREWCTQLLMDFFGGAISGGVFGAGYSGMGYAAQSAADRNYGRMLEESAPIEGKTALLEQARESGEGTLAAAITKQLEQKGKVSNRDAGRLARAIDEAVLEEEKAKTEQTVNGTTEGQQTTPNVLLTANYRPWAMPTVRGAQGHAQDIARQTGVRTPAETQTPAQTTQEAEITPMREPRNGVTPGLVQDKVLKSAHLPSQTVRGLDTLGKLTWAEVRVVPSMTDENGRKIYGSYKDGVITIALDAKDPIMTTAVHETVHRIRDATPDAYDRLKDFVISSASDKWMLAHIDLRSKEYGTRNVNYLTEEVVADSFGWMLADTKALEQFAAENRGAAQKILDAVRDMLNAIRRMLQHQNKSLSEGQIAEMKKLQATMEDAEVRLTEVLKQTQATLQEQTVDAAQINEEDNVEQTAPNTGEVDPFAPTRLPDARVEKAAAAEMQQATENAAETQQEQKPDVFRPVELPKVEGEQPVEQQTKPLTRAELDEQFDRGEITEREYDAKLAELKPAKARSAKITKVMQTRAKQAKSDAADTIAKNYNIPERDMKEDVQPLIDQAVDEIVQTGDVSEKTMQDLLDTAWYSGREEADADDMQDRKAAKAWIRGETILVTDYAKSTFDNRAKQWKSFINAAYGNIKITTNPQKSNLPVDIAYDELHNTWPHLFPESGESGQYMGQSDMLWKMLEVVKSVNELAEGQTLDEYFGAYADEAKANMESDTRAYFDDLRAQIKGERAAASRPLAKYSRPIQDRLEDIRYSRGDVREALDMSAPVEETKTLVALHNFGDQEIRETLKLGAWPSPSIAIVKAEMGHTNYGPYSAIFPRSTIDPEADSRNKVYGGDAWTPTKSNALVEYEVDYDRLVEIEKRLEGLSGRIANGAFRNSSTIRSLGINDYTSSSVEELANRLTRHDDIWAAYLADKGEDVEPVYRHKEYDARGNEFLQKITDRFGVQALADMEAKIQTRDGLTDQEKETIRQVYMQDWIDRLPQSTNDKKGLEAVEVRAKHFADNMEDWKLERFIDHAWEMYENRGGPGTELDRIGTLNSMRDKATWNEVENWVRGQLDGLLGEPAIYNGKDRFTPSGNRRSFASLHWPYTVENIVRAMNQAYDRGENFWGAGASGMHATATTDFRSVDEMHAEEGRLQRESGEAYKERLADLDQKIEQIIKSIRRTNKAQFANSFEEGQLIGDILMDVAKKRTRSADMVKGALRQEGYTVSDKVAREILAMYRQAAAIPTEYFEAKPKRVVDFDEALAVIAPDNMPDDIREGLQAAGIEVRTYEAGNEEDRLAKINEVPEARFSRPVRDQLADEEQTEYNGTKQNGTASSGGTKMESHKLTKAQEKTQAKRDSGAMLTETEFNRLYSAHKLDYTGRWGKKEGLTIDDTISNILANGFKGGSGAVNLLPVSTYNVTNFKGINNYNQYKQWEADGKLPEGTAERYRDNLGDEYGKPVFSNVVQAEFAPRKGDYILLVPEAARDTANGGDKVAQGFKPFPYEVLTVDEDYQKPYDLYKAAYNAEEKVRQSRPGVREALDELIDEYGAIPPGQNPARDVQLPRRTEKGNKVYQTARTVIEAKATPDDTVETLEELTRDGALSYNPISDKTAVANARSTIENVGWEDALDDWMSNAKNGIVSKAATTMGWVLYNNAANEGDSKTALKVLEQMFTMQHNAAQALQATAIIKKLNPETQLYMAVKSVRRLQEELNEKYRNKKKDAPELTISDNLAEDYLRARSQEDRDRIMEAIYRHIGQQMPSDFLTRWNAWRYLAMLGNVRTHVRNVIGNAGFAPMVAAKDLTATGIEKAVYALSGQKIDRTKAFGKGFSDRLQAAWGDYENVSDVIKGEGKYEEGGTNVNKIIRDSRHIWDNTGKQWWDTTVGKGLEKATRFNGEMLDKEDAWFGRPHYAFALAQYCAANNITPEQIKAGKGLDAARKYAISEAQKATYRDASDFAMFVSRLGRDNNQKAPINKAVGIVLEGILPFRKTPANILVRGLEYSPLGLVKSLTLDLKKVQNEDMTAADMIDHLSAGLVGTGLMALGILLSRLGLVRGRGDDDDDKKKFEELQGHQGYALELPNGTSITLDWLAPESLPFFVGVNLYEQIADESEGFTMDDILSAVGNITEPMLELSCLQGVNDVLESVSYAREGDLSAIAATMASAATSYITQMEPTILGQLERTLEDKRYTTYTQKGKFLTSNQQYALGRASARFPGLDYSQVPYIDAWGREELSGRPIVRVVNNFFNPAYMSKVNESDMEKELLRVYDETGESVFPQRPGKSIKVNGEQKDLTAEEYVEYATYKGQTAWQLLTKIVNDPTYKSLSDQGKAEAIKFAYQYADQMGKKQIADEFTLSGWVAKAEGNPVEAIVQKALGGDNDTGAAMARAGFNDTQIAKVENAFEALPVPKGQSEPDTGAKYQVICNNFTSEKDRYNAMAACSGASWERQHAAAAQQVGIPSSVYADAMAAMPKYDVDKGNGYVQSEIQAMLDDKLRSGEISQDMAAALWQCMCGSTSTKNQPYNKGIGKTVANINVQVQQTVA